MEHGSPSRPTKQIAEEMRLFALIFEKGIENEQIERSNKDNIWSFQTKVVKEIQFSTWVVNKSFQNEDNQTKRYCDFQAKQNLENQEVQATKSIG